MPSSPTELLADPKEIAEHVMLIDLARNDIGRIAQTGSVKVTDTVGRSKNTRMCSTSCPMSRAS